MIEAETHEMELVRVDEAGAEEWHCPTCGRRFQMRWPPDYAKVVLERGDEHVTHTGAKGGLRMGPAEALDAEHGPAPSEPPLSEEVSELWRRLLRGLDPEG